jgi:CRISPR-associated exonuclease Cas4
MGVSILILACTGLALLWLAGRLQGRGGLPRGRVIYLDAARLRQAGQPLSDPRTGLTGKPDYILSTRRGLIPVEIKSGAAPETPYVSHVYQLAAYCVLVEAAYRRRPPFGALRYADRTFAVDFSPRLEGDLLQLVRAIGARGDQPLDRSHDSEARCRACAFAPHCDQRLA